MIRNAVLLCVGIIVATCLACAPATESQSLLAVASTSAPSCSAAGFVGRVSYLAVPFSPGPGEPPPPTSELPNGTTYGSDLAAAFAAASPAFQQQLCNLDALYINAATCTSSEQCADDSWGWHQSRPTVGNGRVIALSVNLWAYRGHATPYSDFETDLTQAVLPLSGARYSGANVDTFSLTLLAALAHEMGHIRWYDLVAPNYPDPSKFCGGVFFSQGWTLPVSPPPPWRELLTPVQRSRRGDHWSDMHLNPPHIRDIDRSSDPAYRAQQAFGLFTPNQPWASVFASVSPDEDFVETYKFKVLTTAQPPLTSATLTIPGGGSVNLVGDYLSGRKPALAAKMGCIPASL